jgi:hypothetical protein
MIDLGIDHSKTLEIYLVTIPGSSSDEDEGVQPHEKAIAAGQANPPYCVRNIEQHAFGRREIEIAEQEMPGIMALRARAKEDKPLKDAKVGFESMFIEVGIKLDIEKLFV